MRDTPCRILVPTDFSPASDRALSLAKELAIPFEAEIYLLHAQAVVDEPALGPERVAEIERILATSDANTRHALDQSANGGGTRIHPHLEKGLAPSDAILAAVAEYDCDLVIMGSHGRRGLRGLFLGSVAEEVLHRCSVPVLTTREVAKGNPRPERILVAYDSSEYSLQAVRLAASWALLLSAEITLLHVVEPVAYPGFYTHYTLREEYLGRITRQCHNALTAIGEEHLQGVPYETAILHDQAATGIAEFASSNDFDLVVLATRGLSGISHALFGSVAKRVTHLSEVPVLTVRNQPEIPVAKSRRKVKSHKVRGAQKDQRRTPPTRHRSETFSVERLPNRTILRFHERDSLAGADLGLLSGLWEFFEAERREPNPVMVVLAPPGLLSPQSLERLLDEAVATSRLDATEVSRRIIREENVIQRFITNVREMDSFVVGVAGGDFALPLAAPLFACDYRIISSDSVFVNTTQTLPRAPLNCLPWLLVNLVGGARASQLLLEVPRLTADDARELGLVNHITPPNRLEEEAIEVAERLASLPRATLVSLKRAMVASGEDLKPYMGFELVLTQKLSSPNWKAT